MPVDAIVESLRVVFNFQVTIRTPGLVPILALLPKSVDNVALAHSLILHVHELCAKVAGLLRNYKSVGLFESLCKTLHSLAHMDNCWTDIAGQVSALLNFLSPLLMLRK